MTMTPPHDSIEAALLDVIDAGGGMKPVAGLLWPEKTPDAAHRLLLACMNRQRPERLAPDQLLQLLRLGREKSCHAAMAYLAGRAGYRVMPISSQQVRADFQARFIQAVEELNQVARHMSRVDDWPETQLRAVA